MAIYQTIVGKFKHNLQIWTSQQQWRKSQRTTDRIHPLGAMNVCTEFHRNPSNNYKLEQSDGLTEQLNDCWLSHEANWTHWKPLKYQRTWNKPVIFISFTIRPDAQTVWTSNNETLSSVQTLVEFTESLHGCIVHLILTETTSASIFAAQPKSSHTISSSDSSSSSSHCGGFVHFGCRKCRQLSLMAVRSRPLTSEPREWVCLVMCDITLSASALICTEGLINGSAS